jgi:hypothetical protein
MQIGRYANKERVTAICWSGDENDLSLATAFAMKGNGVEGAQLDMMGESLVILLETGYGNLPRMVVAPGQWLVLSTTGDLRVMYKEDFELVYEKTT